MPEASTDNTSEAARNAAEVDITPEVAELQEAAERLHRQAEELQEAVRVSPAPITDPQSLHRMADYIQQRAATAHEETRRLQGVADRLRHRAQEAEQLPAEGDGPGRQAE